jgi:serine/threonine-protein kinase HipA
MSDDRLVVAIEGRVAGTLIRTRAGLRFDYDDDYRRRSDATPLSVSMPLPIRSHTDAQTAPWMRGLLPDNSDVLDRWARHFGTRLGSTFELLASPVGEDCAGAVQFSTLDRVDSVLTRPGSIEWLDEADVAAKIRDLRSDTSGWLGADFTGQWSLAGAQAKTALRFEDGRWGETSGAAATTHILKPAITGLDDHDLNEHLCLAAARAAGLPSVLTHIEHFEDQSAVVVERYDRAWINGEVERIHQEDCCQALGVPPSSKYEADGGPSAHGLLRLLREVMSKEVVERATQRFVDALAWNWIIGGTDAHAKNYSLVLRGGEVRLAPLYDVASVLPYPDVHIPKLKLAMRIGGEYRLSAITRRSWERLAGDAGVAVELVIDRVRDLASLAPDALADQAAADGVQRLDSPFPGRLVDAVAEWAVHCGRVL